MLYPDLAPGHLVHLCSLNREINPYMKSFTPSDLWWAKLFLLCKKDTVDKYKKLCCFLFFLFFFLCWMGDVRLPCWAHHILWVITNVPPSPWGTSTADGESNAPGNWVIAVFQAVGKSPSFSTFICSYSNSRKMGRLGRVGKFPTFVSLENENWIGTRLLLKCRTVICRMLGWMQTSRIS